MNIHASTRDLAGVVQTIPKLADLDSSIMNTFK